VFKRCPVYLVAEEGNKELVGSVESVRVEGTCIKAYLVLTKDVMKDTNAGRA
jgi:hypothetical protein